MVSEGQPLTPATYLLCSTCGVTVRNGHTEEQCARWKAELATLGAERHDPIEWSKRKECEERGHQWVRDERGEPVAIPTVCSRCGKMAPR